MSEDPQAIDLSSLDPTRDPEHFDEIVAAITTEAADELARRGRPTPIIQLARWQRPMLAAAAVLAIISLTVMSRIELPDDTAEDPVGVAEALGVPDALAQWMWTDELPTTADLFSVF